MRRCGHDAGSFRTLGTHAADGQAFLHQDATARTRSRRVRRIHRNHSLPSVCCFERRRMLRKKQHPEWTQPIVGLEQMGDLQIFMIDRVVLTHLLQRRFVLGSAARWRRTVSGCTFRRRPAACLAGARAWLLPAGSPPLRRLSLRLRLCGGRQGLWIMVPSAWVANDSSPGGLPVSCACKHQWWLGSRRRRYRHSSHQQTGEGDGLGGAIRAGDSSARPRGQSSTTPPRRYGASRRCHVCGNSAVKALTALESRIPHVNPAFMRRGNAGKARSTRKTTSCNTWLWTSACIRGGPLP